MSDSVNVRLRTKTPDEMLKWAEVSLPPGSIRHCCAFEIMDNETRFRTYEVEVVLNDEQAAVILKAMWAKG
jgi:hypothetical protein